jgi:hypothetical protein
MNESLEKLVHHEFDLMGGQSGTLLVEVLLHVQVKVFKDKVKLVVAMHYVFQLNDVGVV